MLDYVIIQTFKNTQTVENSPQVNAPVHKCNKGQKGLEKQSIGPLSEFTEGTGESGGRKADYV